MTTTTSRHTIGVARRGYTPDVDQLTALVRSGRQAQAGLFTAIAAETPTTYRAALQHAKRVNTALVLLGAELLADRLTQEATAGGALLVALTSDDAEPAEVATALAAYQARRHEVDDLLTTNRSTANGAGARYHGAPPHGSPPAPRAVPHPPRTGEPQ